MNPMMLLQLKSYWDTFKQNHPKFPKFLSAVSKTDIPAGSILEITLTTPDGKNLTSRLKVQEDDVDLIKNLKNLQ